MDEKFTVEIISPDRSIYKEEVSEVIIPSYEGELGILKDHIPLITFLRPGLIKIVSNNEKKFFVEDGTVEFVENNLLILSSTVKYLKDFDRNSIEDLINDAEKKLKNSDVTDKEIYLLNHKLETLKNINL